MRRLSYLALSMALMAGPALAVPTSPSDHGPFDQAPYPSSASGILTYDQINKPNGVAGLNSSGKIPSDLIDGGGSGGSYTLPPATTTTLGGVIVGSGLAVATDGTLSVPVAPSVDSGGSGIPITVAMNGAVVGDLHNAATSWQYYILPATAPVGFTVHIFQGSAKDASVQNAAHGNIQGGSDLSPGSRGLTVTNAGTEAAPFWATY